MSSAPSVPCSAIPSNPDTSGPGVRIALYLQSFLSVVLVRFSPKDAPGAYWSMTSTAFSLVISSIVTSLNGGISLLDAIVVVYILLLPILASALGLSEFTTLSTKKNPLRSVHSPLLIVANWMRSALTYSFAMYVWISAPHFGSGPLSCNQETRFIFFGASLPALGSGRSLNLAVWGFFTLMFIWRSFKSIGTLLIAISALFSFASGQNLLKPKKKATNEVHVEAVRRLNISTGEVRQSYRVFRPFQIFHEMVRGLTDHIVSWAPKGSSVWYEKYGRYVFLGAFAAWAIIMTELELFLNKREQQNQWGFGQVLPMVLTISPLFSLYEYVLSRRSSGPIGETRLLRFTLRSAHGLQRPFCELDRFTEEEIKNTLNEEQVKVLRAPSAFAVITIDESHMYTTFEQPDTNNPTWEESLDIRVKDTSTMVIRVFDSKCIDLGQPSFIGYATVLPFAVLPPPLKEDQNSQHENTEPDLQLVTEEQRQAFSAGTVESLALVRDGLTYPDMAISLSFSTNTETAPPLPHITAAILEPHTVHLERRVNVVKWGGKKYGGKKETVTRVYDIPRNND